MDTRAPSAHPAIRFAAIACTAVLLLAPGAAPAQGAPEDDGQLTRLLRHPDVHGDTLAFSYAGDLWVVAVEGGVARRLTAHEGLELFPKFSPDGRWIAFTGDYGGTRQVHVIPAEGGTPRQLTYRNDVGELPPRGGIDNRVLGWTPDGERVIFGAHRLPWSDRWEVPYAVPVEGGLEEPLGVPQGSAADLAADGRTVAYTPLTREFRTWKRYHGGTAQDVWTFDLEDKSARRLTDYDGTDNQPQWLDGTLYFTSDREDGKLNLYALDPEGDGEPRQVTHHETWDVLWPSAGPGGVVYEAGGWIWRFDPARGESARVPIRVYGDFEGRLPRFASVADDIQTASISPSGARALFGARGDVFTVPSAKGEARNLTRSQGVRERDPAWSPDGRWVAYWSDRTGEYELYLRPADGSGEERRITTDGSDGPTWRHAPRWSPDGTRLAFGDHQARLRVVDAETGEVTTVDRADFADITDHRWSPDGRWLAYTKTGGSLLPSVWVHDVESGSTHQLTGDDTAEAEPVWDPEGRYLYFLSNRSFNLTFSAFEFDYVYTDPTRVYVGLLTDDAPPVLLPESDEEPVEEDAPGVGDGGQTGKAAGSRGTGAGKGSAGREDGGPVRVRVDPEGFESRVRAIPGAPGDYRSLAAVTSGILYLKGQGGEAKLQLFDLDAEEEETVLEGVQAYELAAEDETLLYTAFGSDGPVYGIAPAKPGRKPGEGRLDLSGLEMRIDPPAEWRQEFVDGWRILRDWFYDPGMHGLDWQALREKYEPLVDHLAHRADLDYLLGELGGELSAGHVYVQTSDDWQAERREGALLGAEVAADPSGYVRITEIFPGENWRDDYRSPLTEPGVDVEEGDLVLAVDGVSTRTVDNVFELLQGKGDRVITLTVASDPDGGDAHDERVRPVTRETNLRYLAWVESRRRYVEERAGKRIGYIHLPNTSTEGTRELYRGFYAQAHRDALVLDDRYNGGGFIPDGMIELLDRRLLSYWARRSVEPFTTPGFVHRGPKAALANGYAGSGGDAFPWYFQREDLGPVIGTRTWGGLIGISGNPPLADGGVVLAPNFRFVTPEGEWAVEGVGTEPDIEVVDRPDLEARGIDPSLDKAIEVLLEALEEEAPAPLEVPEPPRM